MVGNRWFRISPRRRNSLIYFVSVRDHTRPILRWRLNRWYTCLGSGSDSVGKMTLLFAKYRAVKYYNKYRNIVWSSFILREFYFKSRRNKLGSCETNGTIKIVIIVIIIGLRLSADVFSSRVTSYGAQGLILFITVTRHWVHFKLIHFYRIRESVPPVCTWNFEAICFLWFYRTQETHMKPTGVLLFH